MKFTINGFNQKKLVQYGLDAIDTLLLRYFVDFKDSGNMVKTIIDGDTFYWLKYEGIIKELPILNLKKPDSVYRRLKKMSSVGILTHKTVKEKGTYSYFSIGPTYFSLLSDSNPIVSDINPEGGTDINPEQKINLLKDINNIYSRVIEHLNKRANTKYKPSTKNTQRAIKARVQEGFTIEDFCKVIDNKCQEWLNTDFEKYIRPETLFGTKFESYLNQKKIENKSNNPNRDNTQKKTGAYKIIGE